eukprot:COSAG05_NODE_295_length_11962_cov_6.608952_3_plen_48_part_00
MIDWRLGPGLPIVVGWDKRRYTLRRLSGGRHVAGVSGWLVSSTRLAR